MSKWKRNENPAKTLTKRPLTLFPSQRVEKPYRLWNPESFLALFHGSWPKWAVMAALKVARPGPLPYRQQSAKRSPKKPQKHGGKGKANGSNKSPPCVIIHPQATRFSGCSMGLNKDEQLIAYFAKEHNGATVTQLLKTAYLTDLVSVKRNKKQISGLNYTRYNYGPFDKKIYSILESLVLKHVLIPHECYTNEGSYIVYEYNNSSKIGFARLSKYKTLINDVLSTIRGYGAKTLTEMAYKTKPMLKIGAQLGNKVGLNKKLNLKAK